MVRRLLLRELQNSNLGPNPRFCRRTRLHRKSPILHRICQFAIQSIRQQNHRIWPPKRFLQLPLLIFLLLPPLLFSGEFTASVSRNQVGLGESFTLHLTLKDVSHKGNPNIDALKKSFLINSQQQSTNTFIVNGQYSSSNIWKVVLIPQKEGDAVIPSISIDTSDGTLSSQPITIRVVKGAATGSAEPSPLSGLTLTTDVSNAKPYKNEPIIYTVKLISKSGLANIQIQPFTIEDAIVETNGDPKVYQKVIDGVGVGVIEFSYLITPLKAGVMKIPASTIQGMISVKTKPQTHPRSFFDDDFDPYSMMSGFERYHPFGMAIDESVVDVQPPKAEINPWLPAKSFKIEEVWNESSSLQVGEPFTRSFNIVAEGIKSSQLPSLNDLQISDHSFKIYADKPELGDEVKDGIVKSYRKEQYTLIPQQAGSLTLPEISIAWWDVAKKEKVMARIPSRTLEILPAPEVALRNETAQGSVAEEPEAKAMAVQRDPIIYCVIAGLGILLFAAIVWGIALQKKIGRLTEVPVAPAPVVQRALLAPKVEKKKATVKDKNEKLPDLNPT